MTGVLTGSNNLTFGNRLYDKTTITPGSLGLVARCVTGLGPDGNDNTVLGGWYFKGSFIPNRICGGSVIQQHGALKTSDVGVVDLFQCETFSTNAEGVYTCMIINSSRMEQSMRLGVYFNGRSKSLIGRSTFLIASLLLFRCSIT